MKKNILIFHQNLVMGGVEKVTLNIIKNIDKNKFNIKLILVEESGELLEEIPDHVKSIFLFNNNYMRKKNKISRFLQIIKELFTIKKELHKIIKKEDILLDMNMRNKRFSTIFLFYKNSKIGWIHTTILADKYNKFHLKIQNFLWRQYKIIFNVSEQGKKDFDKIFPQLRNKSTILWNSFNIENIIKKSLEPNLKCSVQNYLLSIGRITNAHKGFDILVKAMKYLKDEGFNEKLYIIGDGPDKDKLNRQIQSLNLEEQITLIGFENNPYNWMKKCKLFILPSNYEGLPTVLIEALACECPIISTDCKCGPREILNNGDYGLLVPVGDAMELKEGIKKMILDNNLRARFKEKSLERAYDFSNKKILKKLENIIERVE